MMHTTLMTKDTAEKTLDELRQFIDRKGYGAVSLIQRETGIGRSTLYKAMNGERVGRGVIHRLEGFLKGQTMTTPDTPNDGSLPDTLVTAAQLETLARIMADPTRSIESKRSEFVAAVKRWYSVLELLGFTDE